MSDDLRSRVARVIDPDAFFEGLFQDGNGAYWHTRRSKAFQKADAALAEMGAVRVKPLEWVEGTYTTTDDDGGPMEGIARKLYAWQAGQYTIIRQRGKDGLYIVRGLREGVATVFPTLEAAKAAAQADYEARILAAIEPAPSVQEAARVSERFHKEQVQIWAQEILEALAMHDLLKIDTYDAKIEAHRAISRELVDIGHALDTLCMVDCAASTAIAEGKE